VSVDGGSFVTMVPIGPNTFNSGNPARTNTMTWCSRLQATTSTVFKIQWEKLGGGTATMDGYLVQVQRSD
jgi:hypothetical protein